MIAAIRDFEADLVITHRPNDYHPDHRHTSLLVQDSAYVVTVPSNVPLSPALRQNPVICYFSDSFQRPYPFTPDVVIDTTPVIEQKMQALHQHTSQMYEWLPWTGDKLGDVPTGEEERFAWMSTARKAQDESRARAHPELLRELYGERADSVRYAEAFEGCEYGRRLTSQNRREIFPMLPSESEARARAV
jgi:LmbE family N-acetylglucosaminyl deacetylase